MDGSDVVGIADPAARYNPIHNRPKGIRKSRIDDWIKGSRRLVVPGHLFIQQ
jgi:hypothetical protein